MYSFAEQNGGGRRAGAQSAMPSAAGEYAQAYVRDTAFNSIYPIEKALMQGTAFPELDQPFVIKK
jgi:hypothetical protein